MRFVRTDKPLLLNRMNPDDDLPLGVRVRCQRSIPKVTLGVDGIEAPGRWSCPGPPTVPSCPGGEEYTEVHDPEILQWAHAAAAMLTEVCGGPRTQAPTLLLLGEFPESVHEPQCDVHLIYLIRDSDRFQLAGQLAHELFHRWRTPNSGGGWAHEMLAEVFRLDFLCDIGLTEYADAYLASAEAKARSFPPEELARVDRFFFPPGFYERALLCGLALRARVGSEVFWRVADFSDA